MECTRDKFGIADVEVAGALYRNNPSSLPPKPIQVEVSGLVDNGGLQSPDSFQLVLFGNRYKVHSFSQYLIFKGCSPGTLICIVGLKPVSPSCPIDTLDLM